eukprot:EG_transcript_18298
MAALSSSTGLFQLLCEEEDPDFRCPLYAFTTALLQSLEGQRSVTLAELLSRQLAELSAEEEAVAAQEAVHRHAKDKLMIELQRVERTLQALGQQQADVRRRRKFAQAALAKAAGREAEAQLTALEPADDAESPSHLQAFLALLRTPALKEEPLVRGLQQFEQLCLTAADTPWAPGTAALWLEVTGTLVAHLAKALPRQQITELRILTEILKRSIVPANQPRSAPAGAPPPFSAAVVSANGLPLLIRLLGSINDDVKLEACLAVTGVCHTAAAKEQFGQLGGIEALVQILNRSNSEAVLQQALVALWNAATVDANKTL